MIYHRWMSLSNVKYWPHSLKMRMKRNYWWWLCGDTWLSLACFLITVLMISIAEGTGSLLHFQACVTSLSFAKLKLAYVELDSSWIPSIKIKYAIQCIQYGSTSVKSKQLAKNFNADYCYQNNGSSDFKAFQMCFITLQCSRWTIINWLSEDFSMEILVNYMTGL